MDAPLSNIFLCQGTLVTMSSSVNLGNINKTQAKQLSSFSAKTGVPVQKCIDQAMKHWLRDEAPIWLGKVEADKT